jgi:hypothetical protein
LEKFVARILLVLIALISAGCATTGGAGDEAEPTIMAAEPDLSPATASAAAEAAPAAEPESKQQEGEVPLPVAETEQPDENMAEVVVQGHIRNRHEATAVAVHRGLV